DERLLYFHSLTQASGHACGSKELKMPSPSSGLLARVKGEAKQRAKRDGIPHNQALEGICTGAWFHIPGTPPKKSHTSPPAASNSTTHEASGGPCVASSFR
ncbi:hypothetical protein, partial [Achromobacter mucicolens]|uniref:hypothetical protein n=1 Tax=Achromobacter mucicolens TaxID=1389922 RepID=UPI0039EFFCE3